MCLGGTKAPQIVYSGPSAEDIAGQNASLQTYMQQSAAQQEQFASSLQKQIEQTNTQAAEQRQKLEQERAAAAADMAAQQQHVICSNQSNELRSHLKAYWHNFLCLRFHL